MLSADDDALLTQTGPGTSMGTLFRRFWVPVLLSREVPEPDGAPVRVTVLGEELVAFRETSGRVGLIDRRCAHRGADLFFGRNEDCGLRCVYHGWKFDADGGCVDIPTMARDEGLRARVGLTSYPTREHGEMVWAYLGPPEHEPPLPALEFAALPPTHRFVSKKLQECNWAQSCEGALDTAHFSFLHTPLEVPDIPPAQRRHPFANATRWMRDDPALRRVPVVVYTGAEIGSADESRLRGLDSVVIVKGAHSPEQLLAATAGFLRRVTAEGCCGRDIAIAASCRRAACPLSSRASIAYRIGTKE